MAAQNCAEMMLLRIQIQDDAPTSLASNRTTIFRPYAKAIDGIVFKNSVWSQSDLNRMVLSREWEIRKEIRTLGFPEFVYSPLLRITNPKLLIILNSTSSSQAGLTDHESYQGQSWQIGKDTRKGQMHIWTSTTTSRLYDGGRRKEVKVQSQDHRRFCELQFSRESQETCTRR